MFEDLLFFCPCWEWRKSSLVFLPSSSPPWNPCSVSRRETPQLTSHCQCTTLSTMLHVVCSTQRDETRGKEIGVTSDRYRNYTTQQTPTNIGKGGKRKNRELRVLKRRNLSTEAYNIDSVSVIYTMSLTTNSSYSRLQCASKAPVVEWCITISNQFSLFFSWMEESTKRWLCTI